MPSSVEPDGDAPIVEAVAVSKCFRQHKRFPGVLGALKSLFTREFTEVVAVSGVSFRIRRGEAVGYLGPNGAGKSTMIKMLTGILLPTSGSVRVLGRVPHAERLKNAREIGVVFGQRSQLWWDLPVIDSFELHRRIYKIPADRYRENLAHFSELPALAPFLERPVRQLSLGQRMRAEVVMALLHDPRILFLDEPTIGLDLVAKDAVRRFLREINLERGITVILTTHDLQDIERICPRLILVNEAQLLFDGPLPLLRSALGSKRRLKLEFAADPGPIVLPYAQLVSDTGALKHYLIEREDVSLVDVLSDLRERTDLKDLSLEEPGIEELIRLQIKMRVQHRAAFLLNRLAQIVAYASAFSAIWVLIHKFTTLAGWHWSELALLLSFQLLAYAVGAALSFTQMRDLEDTIRSGSFDTLLIKPYSPWAYLVFSGLNLGYLGHLVLAVGMLGWSLTAVDIHWTLWKALYALASLLSSAAIVCSLLTMIGACAFVLTRSRYLYNIFFGLWELTRYPLNLFPVPLQWLLLTALPMGFMNYVPVSYLLGKPIVVVGEFGGALAPLSGPLLVGLAVLQWRYCLRRYQGAGG